MDPSCHARNTFFSTLDLIYNACSTTLEASTMSMSMIQITITTHIVVELLIMLTLI